MAMVMIKLNNHRIGKSSSSIMAIRPCSFIYSSVTHAVMGFHSVMPDITGLHHMVYGDIAKTASRSHR